MQHLPLPLHPREVSYLVPCLSTNRYDGGDFPSYPERQGWRPRTAEAWHQLFSNPTEKFKAFLQTWLYFGYLESALGEPANPLDFSRVVNEGTASACRVLDTTGLPVRLQRFYRANRADNSRWGSPALDAARVAMKFAAQIQSCLPTYEQPLEGMNLEVLPLTAFILTGECSDPRDWRVAMAEEVLHEALVTAMFLSFGPEKYLQTRSHTLSAKDKKSLVFQRMREAGWCPSDLAMMFGRLNNSCLYYISHLERPDPTHTHRMVRIHGGEDTSAQGDSKLCSASACALRLLSDETYNTQHAEECNRDECYEMVADRDEVAEILRGGGWPLVMSIDEGDDSRAVTLVPYAPGSDTAYVAISHVWSDGLGNVRRTALPRCQMLKLSRLIRNLPGRAADMVLFWIDTIGCPPDAAHQDEVQNLAISMMRQTYEEAAAVLVLDSWLGRQPIGGMDDTEVLIRIVCSGWNGRLWTLQEGALARTLIFRFADAMYDVDEGTRRLTNRTDDISLELCIKPAILQRLHEFRGFKVAARQQDESETVRALSNALRYRATSVATDEPLCLGALLGLDVGAIVRTAPGERMAKLWGMLRSFPSSFLILPFPRLDVDSCSWAPRSFLLRAANEDAGVKRSGIRMALAVAGGRATPPVEIRPGGLYLRQPGLVFRAGSRSIGEQVGLYDEKGRWWRLKLFLGESDRSYRYKDGRFSRFSPLEASGTADLAVLHTLPAQVMRSAGSNLIMINLVCIFGEQDGVIYARRVCAGVCEEQRGPPSFTGGMFQSYDHPAMGEIEVLPAVSRDEQQVWCLG